ncbi:hypothetical protein L6164_023153 [Bauhinia variegata]|uniref:Uncharacterized protein n=1 Tax=Bauhinia variegata TaxID=167791 RepID=A0ACB9MHT8_BAUVA|nr:hypothetical protein L6164_023153 [Bauhinia variegata]
MGSQTQSSQLPIVNFGNETMKPGTDTWQRACQVVREALEDHGGFLAIFDKVTPELDNSIYSAMAELFTLISDEAKKENTADKSFDGYVRELPHLPLFESLGIGSPFSMEETLNFLAR